MLRPRVLLIGLLVAATCLAIGLLLAGSGGSGQKRAPGEMPRIVEGDPVARGAAVPQQARAPAEALRLLARERRTALRPLLRGARLRVVRAGAVTSAGEDSPEAITFLLSVEPAQRSVAARLPAYGPGPGAQARPQLVHAQVAVLRDLLVDMDLRHGRLLSVEPGPGSITKSWDGADAPGIEDED